MPVWVAAASKAAIEVLLGQKFDSNQIICLPEDKESINVSVKAGALIDNGNRALAIANSDPGTILDITRGMEIWTLVQLEKKKDKPSQVNDEFDSWLNLVPGYGVGKVLSTGKPSISAFAYQLLALNLRDLIPSGFRLKLEIVFPDGQKLAERTSNSAFGVVDGLALIGTQATVQVSASPDQQKKIIDQLQKNCSSPEFQGNIIFVIGENGFDLALKKGFRKSSILKIGNWIGPAIVAAGDLGVKELLLFGYHGKLIKLAGGVFHTHHHLADARLEILAYLAVKEALPLELIQKIIKVASLEEALILLESEDPDQVKKLWIRIAIEIEKKSIAYLNRYFASSIQIGSVLFDRKRDLRWAGPIGLQHIKNLGISLGS